MKISENWLREWVNPDLTTTALSAQLSMSGLQVDGLELAAPLFSKVVVGEVLAKEKHPEADRLSVCRVRVGQTTNELSIVCGASNVRAGIKVPVAQIDAILPGDIHIKKTKLRGVLSEGMICSRAELGCVDKSEGIWILPDDAPVGSDMREYLQFDDHIIDIDLTPNRSDCLSVLGIAREVAALNNLPLSTPAKTILAPACDSCLPITVQASEACPHYVGRLIKGINNQQASPLWLQEKLRRAGLRSISPVVDVTNFVMLELGQPLHAFDATKLHGGIVVRHAKPGEKLQLLDEQDLTLSADHLVIADEQQALALAGIMGGKHSAVTEQSTTLFLESAFFSPLSIAGKGRRLGLHTDSSVRYERGVDFELQLEAAERATTLILQICGGQAGPLTRVKNEKYFPARLPIALRLARVNKILGIELNVAEISAYLQRLQLQITETAAGWNVIAPSYRYDINLEIDVIEEIARLYGYDQLPVKMLTSQIKSENELNPVLAQRVLSDRLVERGYCETINYSFIAETQQQQIDPGLAAISLQNPVSQDYAVMRTHLWPSLLNVVEYNYNRQQNRLRFFEYASVYLLEKNVRCERQLLAGVVAGQAYPEQWGMPTRQVDFYDAKADVEAMLQPIKLEWRVDSHAALHPGQCASLWSDNKKMGMLGALHPGIAQQRDLPAAVFLFVLETAFLLQKPVPRYQAIAKLPSVRRDIAVLVAKEISVAAILNAVRSSAEWLLETDVFDVYTGVGIDDTQKSIALGLTLQHPSRTLIDAEINEVIDNVVKKLGTEFNAQLRG